MGRPDDASESDPALASARETLRLLTERRDRLAGQLRALEEEVGRLDDTIEGLGRLFGLPEAVCLTHFERITEHLRQKGGPATVADICSGTGIARGSVAAVLYRTHPGRFVSRRAGSLTRWELKSDATVEEPPGGRSLGE